MSPPIRSGAETPYTELCAAPVPTPTYGNDGTFTIACSTRISATPSTALEVVLDAPNYPSWNRFCRKCTIDGQPPASGDGDDDNKLRLGTKFTLHVHLDPESDDSPSRPTACQVNILEPVDHGAGRRGWRVTWGPRGSLLMPEWLLRSERVQEFVEIPGGSSPEIEYFCWETFYGPLAHVVRLTVGAKVQKGFEVWMEGLKGRAEEIDQKKREGK